MADEWKLPPLIKVYEAIGAVGDQRVKLLDDTHAQVASSEGSKTYDVETSADLCEVASNDNASYWQGYLGYPGIAVLIARGLYRPAAQAIEALTGIEWKQLNRHFRNDYSKTIAEVEKRIAERGHDAGMVRAEADAVLAAIRKLKPRRGARHRPPSEPRRSLKK